MTTVTVSPKFQIVIPKEVRESLKLKPGAKMNLIAFGGSIMAMPVKSAREMMGKYKGMDTSNIREKKDRDI